MKTIKTSKDFKLTKDYFGLVEDDNDGTKIWGFENESQDREVISQSLEHATKGGCFGYVHKGIVVVKDGDVAFMVEAGFWFSTRQVPTISFVEGEYRVVVWQLEDYTGSLSSGLVEDEGKLNYIDGCKDTMLHAPIKFGDPCLNALYMPSGVDQTAHTHPSTRTGFIIKGGARCETPAGTFDLEEGEIFFLRKEALHKFRTDHAEDINMKLVAYHPDSDFGPTDEIHPMINRTMVEGVSASTLKDIQTK